jgi:hypothetical protein
MEEIIFSVQGSAEVPYTIRFRKDGFHLSASCSCPAGGVGQYCKHRIRLLEGSEEGIVSENTSSVKTVVSWLPGTDVAVALNAVRAAESRFEAAKSELAKVKKLLATTLST